MKYAVQIPREDATKALAEIKYEFIRDIISRLLPSLDEELYPLNYSDFTSNHKIKLDIYLLKYQVQVVDVKSAELTIYVNNEPVAHMKKPFYQLKVDRSQIDPKKQVFYEMQIECASEFDEE